MRSLPVVEDSDIEPHGDDVERHEMLLSHTKKWDALKIRVRVGVEDEVMIDLLGNDQTRLVFSLRQGYLLVHSARASSRNGLTSSQ